MPESREHSPSDDFFNDLSQQPKSNSQSERRESQEDNGQLPKQKRVACVLCRKRKLKCDGVKPSCGTCARLQHDCSYDEVRKKSGPKRGYVKALEARLAQVETLLKTQDEPPSNGVTNGNAQAQTSGQNGSMMPEFGNVGMNVNGAGIMPQSRSQHDFTAQSHNTLGVNGTTADLNGNSEEPFPWEMIGLGLDEPLPTQDVINELNQIYFEKVHPSLPMIHRPRYYAAMNLAPHMRPPVCLRYAMWCNAAASSDKYENLQEHFYNRARKYIQQDEMRGHGEGMITTAHCQTWALLATHEFKLMYFPRAWMSAGRACRMAQMMGLHRLDGIGLDVKQCLPPPKDWTEREERRRTFWMCFCMDRYASIGTGWPMTVEERDILTNLPCDEESFEYSKPTKTMELSEALEPAGSTNLSSFSGVVLMACLFGRNLTHLHRPTANDQDDDLNGEFWRRHRNMDNILLNIALSLPDQLRLPSGLNNPNVVFMNMAIHTSTICLHQAAIFKADKNRMPARISAESKVRCITAAAEIASIMRQISHLDLSAMNPFISFSLYVAARVFVQYLKSRPKDAQVKASLQFLLSAMHAIKRKNPLTESFLVQLDVDLEGAGLDDSRSLREVLQKSSGPPVQVPGCTGGLQDQLILNANVTPEQPQRPAYGDVGLAAYNQPNGFHQNIHDITVGVSQANANNNNNQTHANGTYNFNLPTRQRTPGSTPGNTNNGNSSSIFDQHMDTSPDSSNSNGDQQTPASSSHLNHSNSSRTSNTGYSPSQQDISTTNDMNPAQLATIFDNQAAFTADFNMHSFPNQSNPGPGFILPSNWNTADSGTGLTPTSSSPGAGGVGVAPHVFPNTDFLNSGIGITGQQDMTDADWNNVLDSFTGWDSGMEHTANLQEMLGRRI